MALTHSDLQNIKDLLKVTIEEDGTLVRRNDLSYLPTKDEFYGEMDKVMGELKTVRDEITMVSSVKRQANNHEVRIEKIEKKLQIKPSVI